MERIRVLVIDDSAFMRKIITDILENDERIQVVSTARNGEDALKKVEQYSPDVVTMDVQMPVMDGLQALEIIMKKNPLPVVMVSGETDKSKTIEAMAKGAVDFIKKPSGQISLNMNDIKKDVVEKVIAAASIKPKRSRKSPPLNQRSTKRLMKNIRYDNSLVAIGTSTGGPRALARVLRDLPRDFNFPILIVQHMPSGFTKSLADRLNMNSDIYVKEAEDGEKIESKTAYIAPGNQHMKVNKKDDGIYIQLSSDSHRNGHRPSVDTLLESLATIMDLNKIVVILTGMGNDGTEGIVRLKAECEKSIVIAESEETAIIYGMPKSVINKNKADYILPLGEISKKIIQLQKLI